MQHQLNITSNDNKDPANYVYTDGPTFYKETNHGLPYWCATTQRNGKTFYGLRHYPAPLLVQECIDICELLDASQHLAVSDLLNVAQLEVHHTSGYLYGEPVSDTRKIEQILTAPNITEILSIEPDGKLVANRNFSFCFYRNRCTLDPASSAIIAQFINSIICHTIRH